MQVTLQSLRLRTHRYAELARDEDRPRGLPVASYDNWLRSKAYASALEGEVATAEACFAASTTFGHSEPESWADLYARNLRALVYARAGDWERARALQGSIEAALAEQGTGQYQIRYINAINTARLYRQRRQFPEAAKYYSLAFQTTDGVRTEGDLLYTNLCWARLGEVCGQPEMAYRAWFRAALHWAATAVPEALPFRCAAIVLQRSVTADESTADEFSAQMYANLVRALETFGVELPVSAGTGEVPTFLYTGAPGLPEHGPLVAAVGPEWAVFLRQERAPAPYASPHHMELRRLLWALIRQEAALPADQAAGTIQVDARFSRDIAQTWSETMDTAVRLGANLVIGQGLNLALTEAALVDWELGSRIDLGPGVDRIERGPSGLTVHFRRQWPSISLPTPQAELLELAGQVIADVGCQVLPLLRELERQHVVALVGDGAPQSYQR
jgi:hypothetical protein